VLLIGIAVLAPGHGTAHADHELAATHAPRAVALAHEDLTLPVQIVSSCIDSCGWFRAVVHYSTFAADGSVEEQAQPFPAGSLELRIPGDDMVACCYGAGTITYRIEVAQQQCSEGCDDKVVRIPHEGSYRVFVIG
jgi:hypothetical protein